MGPIMFFQIKLRCQVLILRVTTAHHTAREFPPPLIENEKRRRRISYRILLASDPPFRKIALTN